MRTEVAYNLKRRCKHALRPEAAKKQVLPEALSLLANDNETLRGTHERLCDKAEYDSRMSKSQHRPAQRAVGALKHSSS